MKVAVIGTGHVGGALAKGLAQAGDDKIHLLEAFALLWINLAIVQGQGREIAFKLLKR